MGCEETESNCNDSNRNEVVTLFSSFVQDKTTDEQTLANWQSYAIKAYPDYIVKEVCSIQCFAAVWNDSSLSQNGTNRWDIPSNELDCSQGPTGLDIVEPEKPYKI